MSNLLVELFVEELPPKALKKLGEAFAASLFDNLKAQGLTQDTSTLSHFATPRRLAAHITQIAAKAADKQVAQKLMPASVGLDASGNATPALVKKLEALGANASDVNKLRKESDGKADVLFLDATQAGASLQEGLQKALDEALAKLPIPKVMTYQLNKNTQNPGWESVNFVRPAHGLVALHDTAIVPVSVLGLNASNTTQGHRFEAQVDPIILANADSYETQMLEQGSVYTSFEKRRASIVRQLNAIAAKEGLNPIEDEALLDEVTALVEMPNVLLGQFESDFLEVPQECLILTMKANQKYFPLLDANGKLTNKFLIVSNINPADPSALIGGNERVVRPRLADAKFFFDQDRKKTLASRLEGLNKVVYHNKLGSQGERNARVVQIAKAIAAQLGEAGFVSKVELAAKLSKADLLTDMVGEFPELQGIMGRYYAQHEGLADDVAFAIEDHYRPRFAGDDLPRNQVGVVVALADKLETIVGMFGIGNMPSGEKDPFALRRHALGVVRMVVEKSLPLEMSDLIQLTHTSFSSDSLASMDHLIGFVEIFCQERLARYLEADFETKFIHSALAVQGIPHWSFIRERTSAVKKFAQLTDSDTLSSANKRIDNLLKKAAGEVKAEVNTSLLQEPAEKALNEALSQVKPQADKLFESGDYTASLQALAALKAPVDDFFDNVMVNADDPALKANRLGLLATLHQTMNRVADLSKLAS